MSRLTLVESPISSPAAASRDEPVREPRRVTAPKDPKSKMSLSSPASEATWFSRSVSRLVGLQVRRPWHFLLVAILVSIPCAYLARQLDLRTGFDALLPENKQSVIELKRVAQRTVGISTLAIIIDGKNPDAMARFSDALLPPLRELGPNWIGTAENGVHAEREFMKQRQALYLPLAKVRDIRERIEERYQRAIFGSIDDDEPLEPISKESIQREFERDAPKAPKGPAYRDGYYLNEEGTRLVVLTRTPVASGDLERSKQLQAMVRKVIDDIDPAKYDPSIQVGLAGDVVTSAEQYGVVKDDLTTVGVLGVSLILLIDFLFFLKFRAVLTMALAIGFGLFWTFGVTRLVIGHLNTASGFLVSIIFGNAINYGVLLRARYGEARRAHKSLPEALELAYRDTLVPTLTVAAAAGAGYLSLASTNFRGFRDFGIIGGYGMLLCWVANYLLMPPLLVIFERALPSFGDRDQRSLWGRLQALTDQGIPFGAPFAWLSRRMPALGTATLGLLLAAAATLSTLHYVRQDPFEYNLGRLENDASAVQSAATRLGSGMTDITGRTGQDGMAIMTDRVDQVKPLLVELEKRRLAGGDNPPFQKVVSIFDLIPDDQEEKVRLLNEIRERIEKVHAHGKISAEDWKSLQPYLPPPDLHPIGIDDLPEKLVRSFTERDGTRGRIVYVVPTQGKSVRDLHYLLRWADSFRETKLPSGEVIYGSGRAVIYADMLSAVMQEGPRAALFAAVMTTVMVTLAFMRVRRGALAIVLVLGSLAAGLALMGAVLQLSEIRLNFLNFIAIPITIGIGVDYAINLVHRWRIEGQKGRVPLIVRETGGAVVLCSLTTILGYLALMQSVNPAVRSFGMAAVIGEFTCLFEVMVVLPAVLMLIERRKAKVSQTDEFAKAV